MVSMAEHIYTRRAITLAAGKPALSRAVYDAVYKVRGGNAATCVALCYGVARPEVSVRVAGTWV